MAHLYKINEWQGGSGRWYCNDTQDLAGVSAKWWAPARMLNISLTDYILMLKNDYNAKILTYCRETDMLLFYWNNYVDVHKYVLFINKIAREKNFMV